jgi:hypothetical protein
MSLAADIISYIGIPLAVLGVLPTLYTCLTSFLTLRSIRRTLTKNDLLPPSTKTRSSLLSGIIEIEMPRKQLIPFERVDPGYFALNPRPSRLKGGSWTLFYWREMTVGTRTYRVQYHDEMKQPQAEIELEALVAFLLDRGAVVDPTGMALLRAAGMWTPAGTRLLSCPMGREAALWVTTSDDSDGILSLAVGWQREWEGQAREGLPSYWIRIEGPKKRASEMIEEEDDVRELRTDEADAGDEKPISPVRKRRTSMTEKTLVEAPNVLHMHVRSGGLVQVLLEGEKDCTGERMLDARHLMPVPANVPATPLSTWFATALTALHGLRPHPALWAYTSPEALPTLSTKPTIPVGVLDLLGLRPSTAWRTILSESTTLQMVAHKRQEDNMRLVEALREEGRITDPLARQKATQDRMMKDALARQSRMRMEQIEQDKRREEEEAEAVRSEKVDVPVVAAACLRWLGQQRDCCIDVDQGIEDDFKADGERAGSSQGREAVDTKNLMNVVERILYLMVEDTTLAEGVVKILEEWSLWAQVGGMTTTHLHMLRTELRNFSYAALLMCLIREGARMPSGGVVCDLQECIKKWKKVRLG